MNDNILEFFNKEADLKELYEVNGQIFTNCSYAYLFASSCKCEVKTHKRSDINKKEVITKNKK